MTIQTHPLYQQPEVRRSYRPTFHISFQYIVSNEPPVNPSTKNLEKLAQGPIYLNIKLSVFSSSVHSCSVHKSFVDNCSVHNSFVDSCFVHNCSVNNYFVYNFSVHNCSVTTDLSTAVLFANFLSKTLLSTPAVSTTVLTTTILSTTVHLSESLQAPSSPWGSTVVTWQ